MIALAQFTHSVGAIRTYEIVWLESASDAINDEAFEVIKGDSALTVETFVPDGTRRRFRATGGQLLPGGFPQTYTVRHTVTFASGDKDSRVVDLVVVDR